MKIYIDADGCPVVNIAVELAKEYRIETFIVKNYAHEITSSYAKVVTVDISRDSADFYIVNNISCGDIVVTQDYGLAALCLSKKSKVINQNGLIFTKDNIDYYLNTRHLHAQLRRQNKRHSSIAKRTKDKDEIFLSNFEKLIKINKEI